MSVGQFRFAYYAPDYEATVAFYKEGLELQIRESWDRGPDNRGTIFGAASGMIEVIKLPKGQKVVAPRGGALVIEVDDVDAWFSLAREKGLVIKQEPAIKPWGHRDLRLVDPNGLVLVLFSQLGD